ncbi:MAG TPA: PLDc N-terminal domain-containing protein [Streptosporangiaceae bacterium]|nr:PLDc N-terminal domain-containing protein [Streptosporangiaceae bacterium]
MSAFAAPAVALSSSMPSGKVLLALIPLFVLLAGLIVYCLVDLIRARSVRYLPKPVWALIIVLVSAPLGALAYLVFGKDRHVHDLGEPVGDEQRTASRAARHLAARR